MAAWSGFILTSAEPDGIPSVEVCESMDECIESVRFQMQNPSAERIEKMRKEICERLAWTDDDGTKFSIRKRWAR